MRNISMEYELIEAFIHLFQLHACCPNLCHAQQSTSTHCYTQVIIQGIYAVLVSYPKVNSSDVS